MENITPTQQDALDRADSVEFLTYKERGTQQYQVICHYTDPSQEERDGYTEDQTCDFFTSRVMWECLRKDLFTREQ